jgi:ABC-2 type transport system permease protein
MCFYAKPVVHCVKANKENSMKFARDTWLLFKRSMISTIRNPTWLIFGLFQPVCYLLLFAPLLDGVAGTAGLAAENGLTLFTPGLLILMGLLSAAFVGFGLIADLRAGVVERMRVTPASRIALLLGPALRDVVVLLVQAALLMLTAWLLGLRASPTGIALMFGLLTLLGLTMASCSYALALTLKDENALASIINFFAAPLMLLSGILLPLTLAPPIIQGIAGINPLSHAVEAARALFNGDVGDSVVLRSFVLMGACAALATWWAVRAFRQATA